ncbi:MAG: ribonuclease Z, partial [Desulfovermiculus sp.]
PQSSLYYSGDGRPGSETWDLVRLCFLIVHEGFRIDRQVHGHGTVQEVMELAQQAKAGSLAVVHMQRDERRHKATAARALLEAMPKVRGFLPSPGERIFVP